MTLEDRLNLYLMYKLIGWYLDEWMIKSLDKWINAWTIELDEYESMDVCKSNEWMKELTKYINE